LITGVLLLAFASFAVGRWTARRGDEGKPGTPSPIGSTGAQRSPSVSELAETARQLESDLAETAELQAARAFTEMPGIARLGAWQAALAQVDEKNWRSIFDLTLKARLHGMISEEEKYWMWERLGQVAGRELMEKVKPKDLAGDYELSNGRFAMKGWARHDPTAAWSYIEALPAGNFREGMVAGFVWGIGADRAPQALGALQTLPEERQAFLVRRGLELSDGRHLSELARAWLDTGRDPEDGGRQQVFRTLLATQRATDWSDKSGERLAGWVESFGDKGYITAPALIEVTQRLAAGKSPDAAITWAERYSEKMPAAAHPAAQDVLARYARSDLIGAGRWLNEHRDSPLYDYAAVGFLSAVRGKIDGATAQEWVQTIRDPNLQQQMQKMWRPPAAAPAGR
jgi:hypothetical protein